MPKLPANPSLRESKNLTQTSVVKSALSAALAYVSITAALVVGQRNDQVQTFKNASLKLYFISTTNTMQELRTRAAAF